MNSLVRSACAFRGDQLAKRLLVFAASLLLAACFGTVSEPTGPTISAQNATGQSVVDSDTVQIEGTASDPAVVQRVSYQLNGGGEQPVNIKPGLVASFNFTAPLVDGDNTVIVNAYDASGNVGFTALRFRRPPDSVPPTLTISAPDDGATQTQTSLSVQGTARDNRTVQRVTWRVNNGAEQTAVAGKAATLDFNFVTSGLVAGANTVEVNAYDAAGNRAKLSRTVNVAVAPPPPAADTIAPSVAIAQPAAGATQSTSTVAVVAEVSDNIGVTRATVSLNGATEQPLSFSPGLAATVSFTVANLSTGSNAIVIRAYDAAGNVGRASVAVTVAEPTPAPSPDTTAPAVSLASPATGTSITSSSVVVSGTATDAVGVVRAALQLNGGAEQAVGIAPGSSAAFSQTVTGLAVGSNVILVTAYDAAGNKGTASRTVLVQAPPDTAAPTVSISAPSTSATVSTSTTTVTGVASDNVSVSRLTVQLNGGAEAAQSVVPGSSTTFIASVSGLVSGNNTIQANAYDAAGNRGSASIVLTYSPLTPAPTVPGAPTGVTASAGNSDAVVRWSPPASNGGSAVTSYTVAASPGGATVSVGGSATSTAVTGLTNGVSYTFTVAASNVAGTGPASLPSPAVTPTAASTSSFPLLTSANKRYLVDQGGNPVPILGRTAWFLTSLSVAGYQQFIDDTVAKGYTAVEFHVINHDPRGNNPPRNGNGDLPFSKKPDGSAWDGTIGVAPDFTTPVEAYWAFVDGLLAYCESKGLMVLMFPAYVGVAGGNQGWMTEMTVNGPTRMRTYGAWIATRYKNQKNLVWMLGGDMGTFSASERDAEQGLIDGIKSVAGMQSNQFSAEWASEMVGTDQVNFGQYLTLNSAYSWNAQVVTYGRKAYNVGTMPAFLLEEPYDEEGPDGNNVNPSATQPVRRFQWWGWLSTIGGYVSGNGYVWTFNPGWTNHLNTQGARDMARLNAFIKSINWWELVPSGLGGMKTLVTSGGGSTTGTNYVAAAANPSGSLLVAYVPPDHTGSLTIDMTALSGSAQARWFNPTTATYTVIGTFANTGTQTFTPPGNNGTGYSDWVLVITKQ